MANEVEVKNAMFKLKKVVYTEGYGSTAKRVEKVGIVTPKFDEYRNKFDSDVLVIMGLDGNLKGVLTKDVEIKTTRITDAGAREIVDNLIESAKSLHSLRQEKVKLIEAMKKKEEVINNKITKSKDNITKGINKLKKHQGYVTESDVLNYLKKQCNLEFYNDYGNYYVCDLRGIVIGLAMGENKLSKLSIQKNIDLGKWMQDSGLDFLEFEYDNTMHISNLSKSKDFDRLKKRYFTPLSQSTLTKLNAKETYDAGVGDKYSVEIGHIVSINYNTTLTKDSFKKMVKDLGVLLKEFK